MTAHWQCSSRYADTSFSIADTPPELNAHLFREMMRKTGAERLIIGCQMADTARTLVWSGIPRFLNADEIARLSSSSPSGA